MNHNPYDYDRPSDFPIVEPNLRTGVGRARIRDGQWKKPVDSKAKKQASRRQARKSKQRNRRCWK